jgi:diacylglycerol kinase (ATP)
VKIGILVNANSRRNRRAPEETEQLRDLLGPDGIVCTTHTIDEVGDTLLRLRDAGVDTLALSGGDGTNHHTLTAMLHRLPDWRPDLVLLRGGTMNTVSRSFGLTGRPIPILRGLLHAQREGRSLPTFERSLLRVETDDAVRWGFIFGNGVVHDWLEVYYEDPDPSPIVAARVFARAVASTIRGGPLAQRLNRPVECEVTTEHGPWVNGTFIGVLASTQEGIGLGITPWSRCREREGHFHAIAIHAPLARIARALPTLVLRRRLQGEGIHNEVVREMKVVGPGAEAWILDGDAYRTRGPLTVRIGPSLRFVRVAPMG